MGRDNPFESAVNTSDTGEIERIVQGISSGRESFVKVIENLGPFLSNENESERLKGTTFLDRVLEQLSSDTLKPEEVQHLVDFYSSRMSEVPSVIPAIFQGVLAIANFKNLASGEPLKIILTCCQSIPLQSCHQTQRHTFYSLLYRFLCNHLRDFQSQQQSNQTELIVAFLKASYGEVDPQCLLLVFKIAEIFAVGFHTGSITEDLFEAACCYFPIDFAQPENDEEGISRIDLANALHKCLSSTSRFAQYLLPFLLNKLESDLSTCKIDALNLMSASFKNYENENLQPFLQGLWSRMRREILTTQSKEIDTAAKTALTSLTSALSGESLGYFLTTIWKECLPLLDETSDGVGILLAVASASEEALISLLSIALPVLFERLDPPHNSSRHLALLGALCCFLELCKANNPIWLQYGKASVLIFFTFFPREESGSVIALKGLTLSLERFPEIWSPKDLELLIQHISYWIQTENTNTNNCEPWQSLVNSLAASFPNLVLTNVLPELLNNFRRLSYLKKSRLILIGSCNDTGIRSMFMEEIFRLIENGTVNDAELHSVYEVLSYWPDSSQSTIEIFHNRLILPVALRLLQTAYSQEADCKRIEVQVQLSLLELMVPYLPPKLGVNLCFLLIGISKHSVLPSNTSCKFEAKMFSSLLENQQLLVLKILLSSLGFLNPLAVNKCEQEDDFLAFLPWLFNLGLTLPEHLGIMAAQTVSSLINKSSSVDTALKCLDLQAIPLDKSGIVFKSWLLKALVIRGTQSEITLQLIELLSHEEFGTEAAQGFDTVLADCPFVLNKRSHAVVTMFYKQMFFLECRDKLLYKYHSTNGKSKSNSFRALCYQLKYLPSNVIKTELPPLLPVLVNSLLEVDMNDPLQSSVLNSLEELLRNNASLATEHLGTLISRLLLISNKHSSMNARCASLNCLNHLGGLSEEHTLLLVPKVLRAIKGCLDDQKRSVRKAASNAACTWHMVGCSKD